jgi:hypothetical protein
MMEAQHKPEFIRRANADQEKAVRKVEAEMKTKRRSRLRIV